MRFSLATTLLAVAATAVAQTTHNVTVGDNMELKFNPQNITAAVGDKIAFEFKSKNHTVTQSTFDAPCVAAGINGSAGVNSGYMFIPNNTMLQPGQFPIWTITINTTAPLWFHCAQTTGKDHCQAGMVFSINETPEKSFAAYLAKAMASTPAGTAANTTDPAAAGAPAAGASANAAGGASSAAAPNQTGSPEQSNQPTGTSGASSVVVSRGAAGLLAAMTIGAMLV